MSKNWAHLAVLCAQLLFSGWHILGKVALNSGINPIIFACYREIAASILMFTTAYISTRGTQKETRLSRPERSDYLRFAYLGFASFSNVVGFIVGLKLTSASSAASLQPSIPIFAMILAACLRTERLTAWKGLGIILGVAGAVLVVIFGDDGNSDSSSDSTNMILGHAVLVYQCLMMSSMVVIQKAIVHKYYATWFTFWYYSVGTVLTIILVMYWTPQSDVWIFPGWKAWAALAYAAFFATLICYVSYSWANNYLPSTTVLLYSTVQSVATTTLSFIFLGSDVVPLQIVGSALVIGGLFVTVWSQRRDAAEQIGKDKRSNTDSRSYAYTAGSVYDDNNGNGSDGISNGTGRITVRSIGGGGHGVDEYDPRLMAGIDSPSSNTLTSPVAHTRSTGSNGRLGSSSGIIVATVANSDDDLRQPLVAAQHHITEEE